MSSRPVLARQNAAGQIHVGHDLDELARSEKLSTQLSAGDDIVIQGEFMGASVYGRVHDALIRSPKFKDDVLRLSNELLRQVPPALSVRGRS